MRATSIFKNTELLFRIVVTVQRVENYDNLILTLRLVEKKEMLLERKIRGVENRKKSRKNDYFLIVFSILEMKEGKYFVEKLPCYLLIQ